jgi:LPS export ABC transporter protein LptC
MFHNRKAYHFIIIAFVATCFFAACENNYQQVQNLGKQKIGIEEATAVTSYLSQGGKVKAHLTAPLMTHVTTKSFTDTPKLEFPKTLHVDFYNDTAQVESKLFAKYGVNYENLRKVFLRDSVVVYNVLKGDTLRTNELWWDQDKQILYTEAPVQIRTKDERLNGTGLEADQNFKWYTIKHPTGPINYSDSALSK